MQEQPEETAAQVKLDELNKMLDKYEVQAYRRRVKLHPEDAKMHYELGMILARTGAHDEAIAEFQQAARPAPSPLSRSRPCSRWG